MLLPCNRRQWTVPRGSRVKAIERTLCEASVWLPKPESDGSAAAGRRLAAHPHQPEQHASLRPDIAAVHGPVLLDPSAEAAEPAAKSENTVGTADNRSTEGVADIGDHLLACLIGISVPRCSSVKARWQADLIPTASRRPAEGKLKDDGCAAHCIHNPTQTQHTRSGMIRSCAQRT
jgi:hypothetical protein